MGNYSMINCKLSCVLLINIQCCNRISGCFGSDGVGCQKSCVHTVQESLCYSNALICQLGKSVCVQAVWHFGWLPWINLWFIVLSGNGDLLFFSPDGFVPKQSAGPSGVFAIFSPACHASRFVNLTCVCVWLWSVVESWEEGVWGGVGWAGGRESRGEKQRGWKGRKIRWTVTSSSHRSHRGRFLWTGRERAGIGHRKGERGNKDLTRGL